MGAKMKSGLGRVKVKKFLAIVGAVVCLATGTIVSAHYMLRQDEINYPFREDAKVLGAWKTVDFVEDKEAFQPGVKSWQGGEYIRQMKFVESGSLEMVVEENSQPQTFSSDSLTWTEGRVLNAVDMTDSAYTIQNIEGTDYMFFEWKSGDYTIRSMAPQYYVLERVTDENDEVKVEIKGKVDNIDLPFVNNEAMLGAWKSVDFVKEIDDFNPSKLQWQESELFLKGAKLEVEGRVGFDFGEGMAYYDTNTWTGDVIISKADQTASQCTIQEIEGRTYMFYEWKSGDYTIRGMKPYYYVLKKVN